MIPAAWVGVVIWNPATYHLTVSLPALAGIAATAIAASGGIVAKWGIPVPRDLISGMILRVILYAIAPVLAMIPASLSSIIIYVPASQMIDISLGGLVTIALTALAASTAIFAKWGVKLPTGTLPK
jgi:hypothetical protein